MKRSTLTRVLVRPLLTAVGLVAVVHATATHVRPVFFGRTTVAQRVLTVVPRDTSRTIDAVVRRSPWLHAPFERALETPQFLADRAAFVNDLLRTGRLSRERAERIADAAVTRAYRERIPPALILGVMLTENDGFKPSARSKVGAIGLMQIMPKAWRPTLGPVFGRDLKDDATNVKYGAFILRWSHDGVPTQLSPGASYRTALLRYNGCVRGTNTKNCRRYPDVVRRHVMRSAKASCADRDFETCVVQPLWLRRKLATPVAASPAQSMMD